MQTRSAQKRLKVRRTHKYSHPIAYQTRTDDMVQITEVRNTQTKRELVGFFSSNRLFQNSVYIFDEFKF